jgi:hypothetical protein
MVVAPMNHRRGITTIRRRMGIAGILSRGRTVLPRRARTQRHGLIPRLAVAIRLRRARIRPHGPIPRRLRRVPTPHRATVQAEAVVAEAVEGAARMVAVAAGVLMVAVVVVLTVVEARTALINLFGHSKARFGLPQRAFSICCVL